MWQTSEGLAKRDWCAEPDAPDRNAGANQLNDSDLWRLGARLLGAAPAIISSFAINIVGVDVASLYVDNSRQLFSCPEPKSACQSARRQQSAIAHFLGLLLGGAVQIVAELFWQGTLHGTSVGKFVIAPMATVMGGAAFGVVLGHKRLRNGSVDLQWARAWFLIGALFAVLYVVLVYFPTHANGWMSGVLTKSRALLLLLGLLLPALAASMVAVLLSRKRIYRGVLLWSIIGAIVAGFAAWQMGQARIAAEQLLPDDLPVLILVHAVTPIVSAFVIVIVARLIGFIGDNRETA